MVVSFCPRYLSFGMLIYTIFLGYLNRWTFIYLFLFAFSDEENNFHVINPKYVDEVKERVAKVFGEESKEKIFLDIAEMLKIKNMVKILLCLDKLNIDYVFSV